MVQALVLAAGIGSRTDCATPKALLRIKDDCCVLDIIVKKLWREPITSITVVHNQIEVSGVEWRREFQDWRRRVRFLNGSAPVVSLLNNGVSSPSNRRGSIGDLVFSLQHLHLEGPGVVVACCDNLFKDPHLDELIGSTSAISCRLTKSLDQTVIDGKPSGVDVESGFVKNVNGERSTWKFCGPFYLARQDFGFLYGWYKRHGVDLDDIGSFFRDLSKRSEVRAVCIDSESDSYSDTGTLEGLSHAKSTIW
jgi:NDP-sugar pyrophosphorylase family protein